MENNTNFQTFHQMGAAINDFVKQATGRDNVQNIDIDHITVAQNHYYEDVDVSGSVVSFHAGAAGLPLEKCVVQIEPVQEGSDDPSPDNVRPITGWTGANVTRTGKNLFGTTIGQGVIYGTGNESTSTPTRCKTVGFIEICGGETYTAIVDNTAIFVNGIFYDSEKKLLQGKYLALSNNIVTFNAPIEAQFVRFSFGSAVSLTTPISPENVKHPQLELGSVATDYEPYQGETYDITFPSEAGTVYGGTLDAVSGELVVDRMNIASYNGETLPGKWISDRDVYVEGATPTTGAQVVYELSEPITYQLTPIEITTLLGVNNIWSDAGDIEVKFTDLKELY